MSVLVKICGLSTSETLEAALGAGADMVGFVFFQPSPRHVGFGMARELGRQVSGRAVKVALSVDATDELIFDCIEAVQPQILQLHGNESVTRVRDVKQKFGLPVMKAVAIETAADLEVLTDYAAVADHILFDARAPKDSTRPGGLGQRFDWHLLHDIDPKIRFMLSGGLNAGNLEQALRLTRASGVDVSSGVESAPGVKDIEKIYAFVRAARVANGAVNPTQIASRV